MQRHFNPINSDTLRPVHAAAKIMVEYGSCTKSTSRLNCSGEINGFRRLPVLSGGICKPSIGLVTTNPYRTADRRIEESASRILKIEG